MRRFSVASVLLLAIACAQQNEYTFEPDEEGGSSSGGKSSGSSGKGGSVSPSGGKTSSAGKTGNGGKTTAGTGSGDEGGAAEDGGETGSGGEATAGTGGQATAGSGGMAGNGGSAGSGCTPTTAGAIEGLSARYESEIDGNGTSVGAQLVIFNAGPSTMNLADLKVRYYLTVENEVQATINANVNWAFIRPNGGGSETAIKDLVTFAIVPLACKGGGADTYFEFTFAANAGSVMPGHHVRLSFTANNGSNQTFDQTNDYSFNKDQPSNADYAKVVVIQNSGNRAWGTEP